MNNESTLRLQAREAIRAGKLPNRRAERMWGGPGFGAACRVCDRPVERDELGFELEFEQDGGAPCPGEHHVHIRCFAAWEFELQNSELPGNGTSARDQAQSGLANLAPPMPGGNFASDSGNAVDGVLKGPRNDGTISVRERDIPYRGEPE